MKSFVSLSLPNEGGEKTATFSFESTTPYKAVESLPSDWKQSLEKRQFTLANYPIADILPIHNATGIRDLQQINSMLVDLAAGGHIFGRLGLPNVKLVVVPGGELLLFDGHHTLLSYFNAGKKNLKEIPFLLVSSADFGPVTEKEISFFFAEQDRMVVMKNWKRYTVNWQAPTGQQLEERQVHSIRELANQLGKRDKGSIKH